MVKSLQDIILLKYPEYFNNIIYSENCTIKEKIISVDVVDVVDVNNITLKYVKYMTHKTTFIHYQNNNIGYVYDVYDNEKEFMLRMIIQLVIDKFNVLDFKIILNEGIALKSHNIDCKYCLFFYTKNEPNSYIGSYIIYLLNNIKDNKFEILTCDIHDKELYVNTMKSVDEFNVLGHT